MSTRKAGSIDHNEAVLLAGNIVAAYVGNHSVKTEELPALLQDVYEALSTLSVSEADFKKEPAVPLSKSVTPDYIVCLEDGKKLKMLKRYLRTHYDLSPEEYKRKWRLPADYPLTAPNYAKRRSTLAKKIGLGTAKTTTKRGGRSKASDSAAAKLEG